MSERRIRRVRLLIFAGIPTVLLVTWLVLAVMPIPPVELEVSEETTYLTEPLRPDGTVDYVAALNEANGEGVTPSENLIAALVPIFGPEMLAAETAAETCRLLGVPQPSAAGTYFEFDFDRGEPAAGPDELDPSALTPDEQLERARQTPWSTEQYPAVAAWLDRNDAALDEIVRAADRPKCFMPYVSAGDGPPMMSVLLPHLNPMRSATQALCARAMRRCEQGRFDEAWSDLRAAYRLARSNQPHATLVELLVAAAQRNLASEAATRLLQESNLSAELSRRIARDCARLPALPEFSNAMNLERMMFLDVVQHAYRGGGPDDMFDGTDMPWPKVPLGRLDVNHAMREVNHYYEDVLAVAAIEEPEDRHREFGHVADRFTGSLSVPDWSVVLKYYISPPSVRRQVATRRQTEALFRVLIPSLGRARRILDSSEAQVRVVRAAAAVRAYEAEHGRWPASLDAAMDAVPDDPFSTGPLIYRVEDDGFVVYIIGPDFTDGGGVDPRPIDDRSIDDPHDIVFRYPAPGSAATP
jgi:type II secretory pathway pseudopilin PulG